MSVEGATTNVAAVIGRPGASAESIRAHYDHPAAFFELFLGETMCYSAALFADRAQPARTAPLDERAASLSAAQTAKLDFHLDAAGVGDGTSLLDIGCGWGALLRRAVDVRRARRAVGLTLSRAQTLRIAAWKDPRIAIHEQHWIDHDPRSPYDAIISIGALEHFVTPDASAAERMATYEAFFRRVHGWLTPGGRLSLQCIVHGQDSTAPHILADHGTFPESDLPHAWELVGASRRAFELVSLVNYRRDYLETIACWTAALKAHAERGAALIGRGQVDAFLRYLRYSAMGFALGRTDLLRMSFVPRLRH